MAVNYTLRAKSGESVPFRFLENRELKGEGATTYAQFSAYWQQGSLFPADLTSLVLSEENSTKEIKVQSRAVAFYPDGSAKWTAHTADFGAEKKSKVNAVAEFGRAAPAIPEAMTFIEASDSILIDTGVLQTVIFKKSQKNGAFLGKTVVNGRTAVSSARLVFVLENREESENAISRTETKFIGEVEKTTIEARGPLEAVVKLEGSHVNAESGLKIMPFVVRLTIRHNDPFIRIEHTFTYDGDEQKDFMKGVGIELDTPITGEVYNRHVLFSTDDGSFSDTQNRVWHESSKLLLSWHPKIAPEIYPDQIAGKALLFNPCDSSYRAVAKVLASIPAWSSYRIYADSASHFSIKKGTGKRGCSLIKSLEGKRTNGAAFLCGEDGGIGVCIKDFWQKYPSSIWFDDVATNAHTSIWFYSPESEAYDFRHYDDEGHSGSYYEGYDDFGATPFGISNTNEVLIGSFLPRADGYIVPSESEMRAFATEGQKSALLVSPSEYYHDKKTFGIWSLPDTSSEKKALLEKHLTDAIEFYKNEIEQRGWYGFWDYGDVMHTYDKWRHCWRYDMGGYAWQNTELVPTLWLWYSFLRTGREDIYTMAEAMSRHTSEVDIYHIGRFKGLGSRHNVIHWGCPCKEPRVAMAGHHRFAYYLGGDRRYEDIFDIVKDTDLTTLEEDPLRYFYDKPKMQYPTHARSGPDWSTYTSNWLCEWERKNDSVYRDKICTGIDDLKKAPLKLISGNNFEYDPKSSHLLYIGENSAGGTHLTICMGAPETWFELVPLLNDAQWEKMLADYGVFYFATKEEQQEKSGGLIGKREFSLPFMASAMGAFGAKYYGDEKLSRTVWNALDTALSKEGNTGGDAGSDFVSKKVESAAGEIDEIDWISTNVASQYCLNVIVCLELIGKSI